MGEGINIKKAGIEKGAVNPARVGSGRGGAIPQRHARKKSERRRVMRYADRCDNAGL